MSGFELSVLHLQYWGEGGTYGVTSGYLMDRLDPWGTKGKFLVLTPGGVIPSVLYQGRQVRVVVGVGT